MSYKVKGLDCELPLTVGAIEEYIDRVNSDISFKVYRDTDFPKLDLYRDVLRCVASGAGHAKDLAIAALKLEEE